MSWEKTEVGGPDVRIATDNRFEGRLVSSVSRQNSVVSAMTRSR